MPEYHNDQISRVEQMASGGDTWDLSDNDMAALRTVLDERLALYAALKKAAYELNTIRARDGIPWTGVPLPMKTDVSEEYFYSVVDECFAALAKAEGR